MLNLADYIFAMFTIQKDFENWSLLPRKPATSKGGLGAGQVHGATRLQSAKDRARAVNRILQERFDHGSSYDLSVERVLRIAVL